MPYPAHASAFTGAAGSLHASAGGASGPLRSPPSSSGSTAQSVILVTIDTLRADYLGAYGGPARTPQFDALAAQGWLFLKCISASMLTNPSHASLMTSLFPRDHGVYDNESGIADGTPTLASVLARHGLRTGAVIGFAHLNPRISNLGQGFERVFSAGKTERRAPAAARRALELIDGWGPHEPFFIWLHMTDPHAPYEPPPTHPLRRVDPALAQPMALALRASPPFQRHSSWFSRAVADHESTAALVARYIAEIEVADRGLAVLVEGLRRRGRLDSTALVITSDHGENMGEHRLYFHHGGLYDTTVHVPLVIASPSLKARRVSGLVATVDIAPTILGLLGVAAWTPMRGIDLKSLAAGGESARIFAYSDHMKRQLASVRGADGTLILHRENTAQFPSYPIEKGTIEFLPPSSAGAALRLGSRVSESESLGASRARLLRALRDYLAGGLGRRARRPVPSAADRDSLRALGYVQ